MGVAGDGKRKAVEIVLDDEAEEEEVEEVEEEEEEDDGGEKDGSSSSGRKRRRVQNTSFGKRKGGGGEEDGEEGEEEGDGRRKESKFWKIKCKAGEEREAVMYLMEKNRKRHFAEEETLTRCAIAPAHSRGFIVVEADSEDSVVKACRGCEQLKGNSLSRLSERAVSNMLDSSAPVSFKPNDWVRMKTGAYRNDAAEILDVLAPKQQVRIKLIPRLNLQDLLLKTERRGRSRVYPQKLVTLEDAKALNIALKLRTDEQQRHLYTINKMDFWKGHLIKVVSWKNIEPVSKPRSEEAVPDDTPEPAVVTPGFSKGDRVVMLEGKLKDTIGRVEKLDGDTVYIRASSKEVHLARRNQLRKHFELGAHVRVTSGVRAGVTGMVVNVEGSLITVNSDATKEEIRVPIECLTGDETVNLLTYQMHDLVLLNVRPPTCGVVLKANKDSFVILKGSLEQAVLTVKQEDVQRKIADSESAQDSSGNSVRLKWMVRVHFGPSKGKQGVVQHIYQGLLFILDKQSVHNGGLFCTSASSCVVLERHQSSPFNWNLPKKAAAKPGPSRSRNPLIGKQVKVKRGPFKGYRGHVKRILNSIVYVFLEAVQKEVKVQEEHVVSLDAPAAMDAGAAAPDGGGGGWGGSNENGGGGWDTNAANGGGDGGGWDSNAANGGGDGGGWESNGTSTGGDGGGWESNGTSTGGDGGWETTTGGDGGWETNAAAAAGDGDAWGAASVGKETKAAGDGGGADKASDGDAWGTSGGDDGGFESKDPDSIEKENNNEGELNSKNKDGGGGAEDLQNAAAEEEGDEECWDMSDVLIPSESL